jgi:ribosomal protein L32
MEEMDLSRYFCPNESCRDYGMRGQGNITTSTHYGRHKTPLLRCKTCGKRFSAHRATPFFHLHLAPEVIRNIVTALARGQSIRATAEVCGVSKDTAWRVFNRASRHCRLVVDNLLRDLHLEECQLDELWSFVKKSKSI